MSPNVFLDLDLQISIADIYDLVFRLIRDNSGEVLLKITRG